LRPFRVKPTRPKLLLILAPLVALAAVWAAAYFILGVDAAFIAGLVRGRLAPARTPADVTAPPGVTVGVWAAGLSQPTSLAFGPDGRLYVATLGGEIIALRVSAERDDLAIPQTYATGVDSPLGLAFWESSLYVGHRGGVTRLADTDGDGAADERVAIVTGLPALRHQTNGLAFGPEGGLYIGQGSTTDRGEGSRQALEASILVAERDGSGLRVFASGTRNPYDLAFHPGTGALFAIDNGRDVPPSGVPDELNHIVAGGHYGWPGCWGSGAGRQCAGTRPPVAELPEHAAAGGLVFYTGALFPEWRGHAFVTLYGALSGDPAIGRQVVRFELEQSVARWRGTVHPFAAGLDRPLDITVGPDGALYVADFAAGVIYRFGR
jgi:glucose/arabinose dehydrogenase